MLHSISSVVFPARRQAGFALIETVIALSVGLGLIVGGLGTYHHVDQKQKLSDLIGAVTVASSYVGHMAQQHVALPTGSLAQDKDLRLPGYGVTDQGEYTHYWAQNPVLRHLGDYVLEMTLDDLPSSACFELADHVTTTRTANFRAYFTIGNRIFTDALSSNFRDAVDAACGSPANTDIGVTYGRSLETIEHNTGKIIVGSDPAAQPSQPEPEPTAPPAGGGWNGTTPGEGEGSNTGGAPGAGTNPGTTPGQTPSPQPGSGGETTPPSSGGSTNPPVEPGTGHQPEPEPEPTPAPTPTPTPTPDPSPQPTPTPPGGNPGNGDNGGGTAPSSGGGGNGGGNGGSDGAPPLVGSFTIPDKYLPGGWGNGPGWGTSITSGWIITMNGDTGLVAGQSFEIWGDANPTMQTANGARATSGKIPNEGTNISFTTPACGASTTIHILVGGVSKGSWVVTRPAWPANWGTPNGCDGPRS